jgi:RimJ/RimL family protein N-acetyltransferase
VDTRNVASWMLLESLGFHRAATIKNADEFKGSVSREHEYELASTDWRGPPKR